MKKSNEFHDYVVLDLLSDIPDVTSRAMFGGYGIYKNGNIFAIIVDGELYFKADEKTKKYFEAHGSRPFTYTKKNGRTYAMSYWLVPGEILENREKLAEWTDSAVSASSRAKGRQGKR